ncbi:MAG: hypothetical protein Kow0069_30960 [Promethearchaeota archaeon]
MHGGKRFDPAKLKRLEDPARFAEQPFSAVVELLAKHGVKSPRSVVDLGCGPGFHTLELAKWAPPGAKVWALDVSPAMVERLRENLKGAAFGPVEPRDAEKVVPLVIEENSFPCADRSVDLFFSARVFHEVSDPQPFLSEVARVLAPGGFVLTIDWKKEPTENGPPVEHRVSLAEAVGIFSQQPLSVVDWGPIWTQEWFVLARTSSTSRPA